MAYFGKKFKRSHAEGVEELMDALNVEEKLRAFVKKGGVVTTYQKNDDGTFSSTVEVDGHEVSSNTFSLGEDVDFTRPDGVVLRSQYQFEGDTLTQTLTDPEGRLITFVREFSDDSMTMTISVAGLDIVGKVEYETV